MRSQKSKRWNFTGLSFHFPSAEIPSVPPDAATRCVQMLEAAELDLVQFGITYEECLFHPDADIRKAGIASVQRGIPTAASLNAHHYLFRAGSLNPDGAWTSHRDNHLPASLARLIDTLKPIAEHAERHELTLVMETHAVSIMGFTRNVSGGGRACRFREASYRHGFRQSLSNTSAGL